MNEHIEKMKQFDSIKAPKTAVDKAVKAALDAEKNGKEYTMKPQKKISGLLKVTAAAACIVLAAGIGTSIFFIGDDKQTSEKTQISEKQPVKNSFFLTVNAAELSESETVNFVDFDTSEPGKLFNMAVSAIKSDEILNSDGSDMDLIFYPQLVFPIGCYGDNIKSVKYEINNAFYKIFTDSKPDQNGLYGGLDYTHPGLIEKGKKLSTSELETLLYNGNIPKGIIEEDSYPAKKSDNYSYSSFTVNYDQTDLSVEEINDLIMQEHEGYSIMIKTRTNRALLDSDDPQVREAANYLTHMRGYPQEKEFLNEKDDLRKAILEGMIKGITIEITVTFKNGETEKRTIVLEPGELVTPVRDSHGHLGNLAINVKARLLSPRNSTEHSSDKEQSPANGDIETSR